MMIKELVNKFQAALLLETEVARSIKCVEAALINFYH